MKEFGERLGRTAEILRVLREILIDLALLDLDVGGLGGLDLQRLVDQVAKHLGAQPLQFLGRNLRRDRKRVVSGTSVSVRVDLGGRRIITKKKHTTDSFDLISTP